MLIKNTIITKIAFVVICLCSTMMTGMSQVQVGFVKSRGRLGPDGTVISGERLSGAILNIKDKSPVLSSEKGQFSFVVIDNQYCVTDVQKPGYQLCDMDILNRTFHYSTNDLFIVMDTPDNILADKLLTERKIRRTLSKQLQEKEDEIESLLEQNKITEAEYQRLLQKLYSNQKNNENIISDILERYSSIDFDQIDEFHRKVAFYIQNGQLTMADSLLNTKGSMAERSDELDRMDASIKAQAEDIAARQEKQQKSLALKAEALKDFARDCYSRYEISLLKHQNDSAAYWLQLRSSKDTTNVQWMIEVASFFKTYIADYETAWKYYHSALSVASAMLEDNIDLVCSSRNGIGELLYLKGDITAALEYYTTTLEDLINKQSVSYYGIISTLQNIGVIYSDQGNYEKAMEYFEHASKIIHKNYDSPRLELAPILNNIGAVYCKKGEMEKAIKCFTESLDIFQESYGTFHPNVIVAANNLGTIYYQLQDYDKSMEYYNKALQICLEIYQDAHPHIALCYSNIGLVFQDKDNFAEAMKYYQKALKIDRAIKGNYHIDVASDYYNIGSLLHEVALNDDSIIYYKKALGIWKKILGENHPDVALCYNAIGTAYSDIKNNDEALSYYQKALAINLKTYGHIHKKIATNYNNIGLVYNDMKEYDEALSYLQKALNINIEIFGNHKSVAKNYNNIGVVYSNLKKPTKALKNFKKSFEINIKLYGEIHSEVALNYLNMGAAYRILGNYEKALTCFQKSLEIRLQVYGENHNEITICYNNINSLYWYAKEEGIKLPEYDEYTSKRAFVAVADNNSNNPASKQGMDGRYLLLEYGDWTIDSDINFYAINKKLVGKPKNIVVIKDGVIEYYYFESSTGLKLSYEVVDEVEKAQAVILYKEWKKNSSN